MRQRLTRWRGVIAYRMGLLGAVAVILALLGLGILLAAYGAPPLRGSALLQVLGAAILGAGLSALVGAVTGREAIHQQSSREANLWRKEHTYGPLYAELKAVRSALSDAKEGREPAPLWIDNTEEVESEEVILYPSSADGPPLKCWPAFRQDCRDTDFSPSAQQLLDTVQAHATTYNNPVVAARQAAVPILASHIDAAIASEIQRTTYKQWK